MPKENTVISVTDRMFVGLLGPDLLVRGSAAEPDPSIFKQK
jgi:hypothetical protein